MRNDYENVKQLPFFLTNKKGAAKPAAAKPTETDGSIQMKLIEDVHRTQR
jgi:hypothetical protein